MLFQIVGASNPRLYLKSYGNYEVRLFKVGKVRGLVTFIAFDFSALLYIYSAN
jgi:hypothetical protein